MESGRWWMVTRRWTRRRQWTISNNEGNDQGWISPLLDSCKFLEKEARILRSPVTFLQALKTEESKDKVDPGRTRYTARDNGNSCLRAFATGSSEEKGAAISESRPSSSSSKLIVCLFYKDNHELDMCMKFTKVPLSDRKKFSQDNALCWGCLKWGHMYKESRGRKTCWTCNRRYPTSLQDDSAMPQDKPSVQENRVRSQESNMPL